MKLQEFLDKVDGRECDIFTEENIIKAIESQEYKFREIEFKNVGRQTRNTCLAALCFLINISLLVPLNALVKTSFSFLGKYPYVSRSPSNPSNWSSV